LKKKDNEITDLESQKNELMIIKEPKRSNEQKENIIKLENEIRTKYTEFNNFNKAKHLDKYGLLCKNNY